MSSARQFDRLSSRSARPSSEAPGGDLGSAKRMTLTVERHRFDKLVSLKGNLPPRVAHASAGYQSKVFVFGGEVPQGEVRSDTILLSDLWVYEQDRSSWRQICRTHDGEPWPEKRKGHTLVTIPELSCLLLFGGVTTLGQATGRKAARRNIDVDDEGATGSDLIYYNDVWMFNCAQEKWVELAVEGDKPLARAHHSASAFGSVFMFVFGGYGCHEDPDIWVFDIANLCWDKLAASSECTEKPPRRFGHISTVHNNCFYVFGGVTKNRHCDGAIWKFNTIDCTWKKLECSSSAQNVPIGKVHSAAAVVEGRWLVHGGHHANRSSSDFHEFNLRTEKWRNLTAAFAPSPALAMHQACVVSESPYIQSFVITGGANSGATNSQHICIGSRVDFVRPLNKQALPSKLEDGYVSWPVKEVIMSLWSETAENLMDRAQLARLQQFEKQAASELQQLQALNAEAAKESSRQGELLRLAHRQTAELDHQVDDLRKELTEASQKADMYEKQLEVANEAYATLERTAKKAETERDNLLASLEDLEREVSMVKRDHEALSASLAQSAANKERMEEKLKIAEQKALDASECRQAQENELCRVSEQLRVLRETYEESEKEREREKYTLEKACNFSRQEASKHKDALAEALAALECQRVSSERAAREWQERLETAVSSERALGEEKDNLRKELEDVREKLRRAEANEKQANDQLVVVVEKIKGAIADAGASKAQFERSLNKEKARTAAATAELQAARAEIADLRGKCDEIAEKMKEERRQSEHDREVLEKTISNKVTRLEAVQAEVEKMRTACSDANFAQAKTEAQLSVLMKQTAAFSDILRRVHKAVEPIVAISPEMDSYLEMSPDCATPSTMADLCT